MDLDDKDVEILRAIQSDASLGMKQVAKMVGLSATPCWRRILKLEESGYIVDRVARLDAEKVGVPVTVIVEIKATEHSEKWYKNLVDTLKSVEEVQSFFRMSGEVDYLAILRVPDIAAYDRVYKLIVKNVVVRDVTARFCIETIIDRHSLPLKYALDSAMANHRKPKVKVVASRKAG